MIESARGPELPWTGERLVTSMDGEIKLEHLHRYGLARDLVRGLDVLDIACGEGYGAALLGQTVRSVVGMDHASEVIAHARGKYQAANVSFAVGRCEAIPMADAAVDAVVSFETIEHIVEQAHFLSEVKRVLRPGGLFMVSSPNREEFRAQKGEANRFHLRELSFEELSALLTGRFRHVVWLGQRVCYASVAFAMDGEAMPPVRWYEGDYEEIRAEEGQNRPLYFIGIASDEPVQAVNSVFDSKKALDHARKSRKPLQKKLDKCRQRLEQVENSTWWRLRRPLRFLAEILTGKPGKPAPGEPGGAE